MKSSKIKHARVEAGLSQADLAERTGVSQALVSRWERGKSTPSGEQSALLQKALKQELADETAETSPGQAYGEWLRAERDQRSLSRRELAAKSGVSSLQIYNIETGRTTNPRDATRTRLERALGAQPPKAIVHAVEESGQIVGVGRMSDFDPHSEDDFPNEPGIYVLYDISDRPVYVGKSADIRRRLRDHLDRFWYHSPIVERASYVRVEDDKLRGQLEETLIKFLKSNAVINQKLVDR